MFKQHIVSSSPELRQLQANLKACSLLKENEAVIAEKKLRSKEDEVIEHYYAKLVKELSEEERKCLEMDEKHKQLQKIQQNWKLREQIAEKSSKKAELEAEKTIELISNCRTTDDLKKEAERLRDKKLAQQLKTYKIFDNQCQMKELKKKEEELLEQKNIHDTHQYNLMKRIQKELENQQQEYDKLLLNQREFTMVTELEHQQKSTKQMKQLQKEIEILEHEERQEEMCKRSEDDKIKKKLNVAAGYDKQIREKHERLEQEKINDQLYIQMLMQIQAEESKLDQLANQAKKRRQKDHQILADKLLEERRHLRALLKLKEEEELQSIQNYHDTRNQIIKEEERKLLLEHAPHLLPYFTPKLLQKFNSLN